MPHSSGGGSHGGGSHHSSSHGSGGDSGVRTSSRYFPGSHRYVYYRNYRPIYYFSNAAPPTRRVPPVLTLIVSGIILVVLNVFLVWVSYERPRKLAIDYDATVQVIDNAGVMADQEERELTRTLQDFLDLTGITPVVLTDYNSEWQGLYSSLENFAYDRYVNMFSDEKHWLIVYTEPENAGGNFNDWYWEGMQGDDTDPVLTSSKADRFTDDLHKRLLSRSKNTVAKAMNDAFRESMKDIMKEGFTPDGIQALLIVNGIGIVITLISFFSVKSRNKLVGAARCATDQGATREDKCEYCGGLYVHGLHLTCPHCNAPIPPSNYGGGNQPYNNQGYNNQPYNNQPYNNQGYNDPAYNNQGYAAPPYNDQSYNNQGYNAPPYNNQPYNGQGYNNQPYNEQGYNAPGYSNQPYNGQGYNAPGYNNQPYNAQGNVTDYNNQGNNPPGSNNGW